MWPTPRMLIILFPHVCYLPATCHSAVPRSGCLLPSTQLSLDSPHVRLYVGCLL